MVKRQMTEWQLHEANARLSEVIKKAAVEAPQRITVRGEPAAVVLATGAYLFARRNTRSGGSRMSLSFSPSFSGSLYDYEGGTSRTSIRTTRQR